MPVPLGALVSIAHPPMLTVLDPMVPSGGVSSWISRAGTGSSSAIVTVWTDGDPITAAEGLENPTVNVSVAADS
jgi:hypothetical protein